MLAAGLAASVRPAGSVSVNVVDVSGFTVRLKTVNVKTDVWPDAIALGENAFVRFTASMTGRLTEVVLVLLTIPPGPIPSPVTPSFTGRLFVNVVETAALDGSFPLKVMVHRPAVVPTLAGIVPP